MTVISYNVNFKFEASRKKKGQREQKSKNKKKNEVRFSREDTQARLLLPEETIFETF